MTVISEVIELVSGDCESVWHGCESARFRGGTCRAVCGVDSHGVANVANVAVWPVWPNGPK